MKQDLAASRPILTASLWRFAFIAAALFAVVMASLPQPLPGDPPDKLLHAFAFGVLTILARAAYPRASAWRVLIGLGALGAVIELIQLIPALGREASLMDWLADVAAIAATLGVLKLASHFWPRQKACAS